MVIQFILQSPRGLGTTIRADYEKETVSIENHTDHILDTAFGVNKNPTWQEFEAFLEERCFPRTRDKMKLQLRHLGLDSYDPFSIIQKTNGRMAEDDMWVEIVVLEKERSVEEDEKECGRE